MAGNKIRAATQMEPGTTTTGEADKLVVLDGAGGFVATGHVVQVVNFQTGAVATGTTVMPVDDTIPQNTEGTEFMTLAIIPKASNSLMIIQCIAQLEHTAAQTIMTAALFKDSDANALAVGREWIPPSGSRVGGVPVSHKMISGTTSEITFKIRAGDNSGGTMTFNGSASSRQYGGAFSSSITIWEIAA